MNRPVFSVFALTFTLSTGVASPAMASEARTAVRLCEQQIRDHYSVDRFKYVVVERDGNHKFKVDGKVRVNYHNHPFHCKIKNGRVKSFAYEGPSSKVANEDDDSGLGTVVAVGAGLAILAALAASGSDDSDGGNSQINKATAEDDCHDQLQYRIRDEHDHTAAVKIQRSDLEGRNLTGEAKVKYHHSHPHHARFTCHFDARGRLHDSQYRLY